MAGKRKPLNERSKASLLATARKRGVSTKSKKTGKIKSREQLIKALRKRA